MPHDAQLPGSPADWLARAEGDLALAKVTLPEGGFYEDLCFHAQQAAEKALKAVYRIKGLTFRYTHDLDELISGLEKQGVDIPTEVKETIILTEYAGEARYPGLTEPVTVKEHQEALRLAEKMVTWAQQEMEK